MTELIGVIDDAQPVIHVEIQGVGPQGEIGPQGPQGEKGDPGPPGVVDYSHVLDITAHTHEQAQATTVWAIQHDLGFYPSATVMDSAGTVILGDVRHIDENNLVIEFAHAESGKASLT